MRLRPDADDAGVVTVPAFRCRLLRAHTGIAPIVIGRPATRSGVSVVAVAYAPGCAGVAVLRYVGWDSVVRMRAV